MTMLFCVNFVLAGTAAVEEQLAPPAGGVIIVPKFRHSLFYYDFL